MSKNVHPVDRLVGQRVRLLRMGRNMSQSTLASWLGLTFQQVQKYEKGTNRISASKLVEIASALDVDVAGLFQDAVDQSAIATDGRDAPIPSQIDLSIIRKLSQISDAKVKRQVLALISALAGTAESSSSTRSDTGETLPSR